MHVISIPPLFRPKAGHGPQDQEHTQHFNKSCQRRSTRRRGFLRQRSPSNQAHTSESHSARLRTNKRCGAVRNCTMIASHRVSLRSGNRFNEETVSERSLDAFPPCHQSRHVAPSSTNYKRKYCELPWTTTTTASDLCSCQDGLVIPHPAPLEEEHDVSWRSAGSGAEMPTNTDGYSRSSYEFTQRVCGGFVRMGLVHFITSAPRTRQGALDSNRLVN